MEYYTKGSDIIFRSADLDLEQTLDCGQAFRWEKTGENTFSGYFFRTPLTISQNGSEFTLFNTSESDFLDKWADYFDLNTDYGELKRRFSEDETLSKACSYAWGIRLLRQDSWETLISFIISQNNNIPRIKGIIGRLCEKYGGFPEKEQLKENALTFRVGDTVKVHGKIKEGEKERIQIFEGIVTKIQNGGSTAEISTLMK